MRPVSLITAAGVVTDFAPAADTDAARGDALVAAIAAITGATDLILLGVGGFAVSPAQPTPACRIRGQGSATTLSSQAAGTRSLSSNSGTLYIENLTVTTGGLGIGAGNLALRNVRIDTSGSATDKPIVRTGAGTLSLKFCDLKAHASVVSIDSGGSALAVTAIGSTANKDPDGNATISPGGGLFVDSTAP